MGDIRKKQKLAKSKKQAKERDEQIKKITDSQGGRFVSDTKRVQQLADQQLKDAPLNDPVARIRALENQFASRGGLSEKDIKGIVSSRQSSQTARNITKFNTEKIRQAQAVSQQQARLQAAKGRELAVNLLREGIAAVNKARANVAAKQAALAATQTPEAIAREQQRIQGLSRAQKRAQTASSTPQGRAQQQLQTAQQELQKVESNISGLRQNVGEAQRAEALANVEPQQPVFSPTSLRDAEKTSTARVFKNNRQQVQGPIQQQRQQQRVGFIPPSPVTGQAFFIETIQNPLPNQDTVKPNEAKNVKNPVEDFLQGVSDPFANLARVVSAAPEAVRRDIEQRRIGAGDEFFQQEVAPDLQPTAFNELLEGRAPDLANPRIAGTAAGEALLVFTPTIAGRVVSRTPKPVDPSKVIKNVKSRTINTEPAKQPQNQQIRIRPANPFRERLPPNDELFALDTASPFAETVVSLGRGTVRANPFSGSIVNLGRGTVLRPGDGGLPSPPSSGNFPTTRGGGTFSRPRFSDPPSPRPGQSIIDVGNLQQLLRTKQVTKQKTKQVAKQKTKQKQVKKQDTIERLAQQASVTDDILFSKPRQLQKKKKKPQQTVIFDIVQGGRFKQDIIQDLGLAFKQPVPQKTTPKLGQPQKQKQRLDTPIPPIIFQTPGFLPPTQKQPPFLLAPPTTRLRPPLNPPRPPNIPFGFPPNFPFLLFGAGSGDVSKRRRRGQTKFLASNIDPLRPGVIDAFGVPELQVSRSKKVFKKLDRQLEKSRKKKLKPAKSVLDDPFGAGLFDVDVKF